jgi:hypothetical protein
MIALAFIAADPIDDTIAGISPHHLAQVDARHRRIG